MKIYNILLILGLGFLLASNTSCRKKSSSSSDSSSTDDEETSTSSTTGSSTSSSSDDDSSSSSSSSTDTTAPSDLDTFSLATGSEGGKIVLTLNYPSDTSDFDEVKIYRVSGSTAPNSDCATGTLIYTDTSSFTDTTVTDSGLDGAGTYSYRICTWDASDNNNSQTAASGTAASYTMFVSDAAVSDGNLGGLTGADALCDGWGDASVHAGTWKAWLSDSTGEVGDGSSGRLTYGGTAVMPDATTITTDMATDMWNGGSGLDNALDVNQNGVAEGGVDVWTGTRHLAGIADASHCSDWGGTAGNGANGDSSQTDSNWVDTTSDSACTASDRHLYCIDGQ